MNSYKVSKYTYFSDEGSKFFLINTISKKLVFSENVKYLREIMSNSNLLMLEDGFDSTFKALIDNGFIVNEEVDEDIIAEKRYWDTVYDNRLGITILPTEQCNCRCPYCYEEFIKPKMSDEMSDSIIKFLYKNLINYNGLNISWFGGEPLLAMDVIEKISKEAISICRAHRISYDSSITTNGVLLTEKVVDKLIECRINRFQITLEGPEKVHNKTRILKSGDGTFETIINNLLLLKKRKKSTLRINIRVNVTKELIGELSSFIDFLYDNFGNDNRFSFYFRPIGDWNDNITDVALKGKLLSSLKDVYPTLLEHPRKLNYGILYQLLNESMCYASKKNHFVLGADGNIYKCTVYFNEDINKVGELTTSGQITWNEEKLSKWMLNSFNNPKCNACFLSATCHGKGCPANSVIYNNNVGCGHEIENITSILKLLYQSNDYHGFFKKLEE